MLRTFLIADERQECRIDQRPFDVTVLAVCVGAVAAGPE